MATIVLTIKTAPLKTHRCNATLSNEFAEFLATYDLEEKARQCGYMPNNPRHARIFVALECVASISTECLRESQDLAAFNNSSVACRGI